MSKLPKAPEHDIRWAQITTNCETNMKEWIGEIINLVKDGKVPVAEAADELYDELTKTDFEARMIAMLGDYISPKYEPFAYKYGLGKGIIGNFATHYVVGDIYINNFKKAFPENRGIYSFVLGRYI